MIPKIAVRKFIEAPRDSYLPYKKFSPQKLRRLVSDLPVRPPIWKKLRRHQKVCFLIGVHTHRYLFFCDTGMGKTCLSIALTRYFRRAGLISRVMVLVPNRSNTAEWSREIRKHSPKSTYTVLKGSSKKKWELLRGEDSLFYIITYSGFSRMVCKLGPKKRGKEGDRLIPDPVKVKEIKSHVQGLFFDESTFIKNHRKLPYRILHKISKDMQIVFALTGMPFGRNPADLWAQFHAVDLGVTLGPTLGLFRAAFFKEEKNYWSKFKYSFEYTFIDEKIGQLRKMIENRSIYYEAEESDLPRVTRIKSVVRFPVDTYQYYEIAKQKLIAARGDYQEMKCAFTRMRQISSGFVGYWDDKDGRRAEFGFDDNPKLDKLLEIIESISEKRKIIVFHEYIFSGSVICRELEVQSIGYARLWSGTKDPAEEMRRFDEDPECWVFVVNNSAGAFGLNLQVANYVIYYESPTSPIIRYQTERRTIRSGQKRSRVFMYDLIMRNSYDRAILQFHKRGADLLEAILKDPDKLLLH